MTQPQIDRQRRARRLETGRIQEQLAADIFLRGINSRQALAVKPLSVTLRVGAYGLLASMAALTLNPTPVTATTLETIATFNGSNGDFPKGGLISDANGNLFGTTLNGGTNREGIVFELSPSGNSYNLNTLATFNGSNGAGPEGGLISDANGNLFGTTGGGTNNVGTVFELSPSGNSYNLNTLATFNFSNGDLPNGGLISDANGNLFGTTSLGGTNRYGTVFELSRSGNSYNLNTLATFTGSNGANPKAGLISDANGNLFGTTNGDGINNVGTVFELSRSGNSYNLNTLATFTGSNGANPQAGLISDANGNLFGTTSGGGSGGGRVVGGTVFELSRSGNSYNLNTLANFNGSNGGYPLAGLISDANGNLFGTTFGDTINNDGTVFELSRSGNSYNLNTLATFTGSNGSGPEAGLISDANGNLFGTTSFGGKNDDGTVFELTDTPFQPGTPTQSVPEPSALLGMITLASIGFLRRFCSHAA